MENENAIVMQKNGLVGVNNKKVFCSLDMSKEENIDKVLATQDSENMKYVKDMKGQTINVTGVYITERESEDTNDEGVVYTKYNHVTILFDDAGNQYVTGSNAFYQSLDLICSFKGYPTEEKPLAIKIIETPAKENGHTYLKCTVAK